MLIRSWIQNTKEEVLHTVCFGAVELSVAMCSKGRLDKPVEEKFIQDY